MNTSQQLNGHPQNKPYVMDDKSRADVEKAEKLKEKGDWLKCEKKIARVVKKHPDFVPALQILGLAQIKLKKLSQAYKTYNDAVTVDPNDKISLKNRALVAFELEDDKQIEEAFKTVFDHITNDIFLFNLYGAYLQRVRREKEALTYYKKALDLDPELTHSAESLLNMAAIFHQHNEYQSALDLWMLFLQKHPKSAEVMCYIADTLYYLGRKEDALEMAVQALAHDPDNAKAHAVFAFVFRDIRITEFRESVYQALYYCLNDGRSDFYDIFRQWLGLLVFNPEFEALAKLREDPSKLGSVKEFSEELKANLLHPYFLLGLKHMIQADVMQEIMLMRLRAALLEASQNGELDETWWPLLSVMGEACFMNEYVWSISKNEQKTLATLRKTVEDLKSDSDVNAYMTDIIILSSYVALKDLDNREVLLDNLDAVEGDLFTNLAQLQIRNPMIEVKISETIDSLSDIEDEVSQKVRAQYEENPYPRWRSSFVQPPSRTQKYQSTPKEILIAGCGTGRHLAIAATQDQNANILGLDLSMASLAYAKRQIDKLGIPNISYIQGDILEVSKLGREFDHIESAGVLHHMDDPLEGWRQLVNILKPGGTMRIGLYSEIARQGVVAMREEVTNEGFKDDLNGIRAARLHAFAAPANSMLKALLPSKDFYSTSACRDLIMHVQEHRYTIERLTNELIELGLEFTGMCPAAARMLIEYGKKFPDDSRYVDLPKIKEFEEANPSTFGKMYQFTVRKPA